jgi:Lrp/AsnC family leucine-responsive transcriptional regulator
MTSSHEKLLDRTGWRLLQRSQEQARLSFSELGRQVGLTPPAAVERVRRLEDAGIIVGYRAEVDPAKLGLPIAAFIRLSMTGPQCSRFGAVAREIPEIVEAHRVTGGDSYILKVAVASVAHLEALIDRLTPHGQPTTSVVLSSPVTRRTIEREPGDA